MDISTAEPKALEPSRRYNDIVVKRGGKSLTVFHRAEPGVIRKYEPKALTL
jgi:hypothetical protein